MSDFRHRLRELRKASGLSQVALAESLGISKASIAMYEVGENEASNTRMELIADFFDVDMDYLYGRTDVKRLTTLISIKSEIEGSILDELRTMDETDKVFLLAVIKALKDLRKE